MSPLVTVLAPAKLNLALAVGAPRADGMHPICSWMVTVDLCDELEVTRLPEDRFSRYAILWHEEARKRGEIDWSITKDLAVRAHLALEAHVGRRLPVQLKLEKRIPLGGGLGGGSADAGAMLRALNTLFELELPVETLAGIGAELGSDVPFMVHGGSATVEDLGGTVRRHEAMPDLHGVIVFPRLACATPAVYRAFDEIDAASSDHARVHGLAPESGVVPDPDALFNDLTPAALAVVPALGEIIAKLTSIAERPALLSGSGSSIFVLCDDALHAEHLANAAAHRLDLPAVAFRGTP
jgi:4-diphosphocytidyl-2-C-methyl-D-erythritol kinase